MVILHPCTFVHVSIPIKVTITNGNHLSFHFQQYQHLEMIKIPLVAHQILLA